MSRTALEEVNASLKTKSEAMVNLLDKMDGEKAPTEDQLKGWQEELTGIEGEMKSLNTQRDDLERRASLRDGAKNLIDQINEPVRSIPHGNGSRAQGTSAVKTWGERYVEGEEFKAWIKSIAPSGQIPDKLRIGTGPVLAVPDALKTLITGLTTYTARADTSGGALVQLDQRGLLDGGVWQRPLKIRDLVSKGTTTGDTIEYVRITGVTNSAAPVAEATASGGSSGIKPASGMAFEVIQDRVRTLAHHMTVTRRALSDVGQLRSYVDDFLRYGLEEELEDQMVGGSGSGENFTGVKNVSGILTQAFDTDRLTTSRKAINNMILNGRVTPSAWAMYPTDWMNFDLEQDNEARYYFGGPASLGQPRLWGVPVVQTEAATSGQGILGAWRYAMLWDREETNIMVSDSHGDNFIRNLVTILAEMRAGFGVLRAKAFETVAWS
jgi:HK97 family phage major capsid protein